MEETIKLPLFIEHSQQGAYFTLPFTLPQDVEQLNITYSYQRYDGSTYPVHQGIFTSKQEINIIDLGLIAPDGSQVGASGSDKTEIFISQNDATPGYSPHALPAGEWSILVGAYKIAPEGVKVSYTISYKQKKIKLLKGDLHMHTLASDGVHTVKELATKAMRNGLDFIAITDHNQMVSRDALPKISGITLIPGVEWTHYLGHANFLGVDRPYDGPFMTNSDQEMQSKFAQARQNGALITVNHPFESGCEFKFDLNSIHFDALEVWNGPMRESNLRAVGLWQQLLCSGLKIPACGGSDYHRDTPFIFLGGPTMGVYSRSTGFSDILEAIRQGHAYITFAPNGPSLDMHVGDAMMGDSTPWKKENQVKIQAQGLQKGDIIRAVTQAGSVPILEAPQNGEASISLPVEEPGFMRIEILRSFLPGIPPLPALLGNPIYFDAG